MFPYNVPYWQKFSIPRVTLVMKLEKEQLDTNKTDSCIL